MDDLMNYGSCELKLEALEEKRSSSEALEDLLNRARDWHGCASFLF